MIQINFRFGYNPVFILDKLASNFQLFNVLHKPSCMEVINNNKLFRSTWHSQLL